jgi:hypothetical protein
MPINGLEIANQSGSASRNGNTSRLCARALATGKNVAGPAAKAFGVPVATSRELIVFMLSKLSLAIKARLLRVRGIL